MVYDPANDRVHLLNRTAAEVLDWCTGDHSPADLARLLQNTYGLEQPPIDEVMAILDNMTHANLVTLFQPVAVASS